MEARKKIVMADDQIANLAVGREVLSAQYDVFSVPSGDKLLLLLKKIVPDMILLDIEMPGMNGYDTIKALKDNPETANIPVIFLTARNDAGSEIEGLSLGAVDYIYKPFSAPLLLKRVEVHLLVSEQRKELENYAHNLEDMVREKTKKIYELQGAIIETIAELVERRDNTTGGHIARASKYLEILINEMIERKLCPEQTSKWNVELALLSAQLHDVGKIAISDSILGKPGKLTEQEFEQMKNHSTYGGEIIEMIQSKTSEHEFLEYAKTLALYHHEKWNGTGYPDGIAGDEIPLLAQLMAFADVYDALISERPYKKPFTHEEAIRIIEEGKGTQFSPVLTELFLSVADKIEEAAKGIC